MHCQYLQGLFESEEQYFKEELFSNKVDIIKRTFDSKFNNIDEETLIQAEILRQGDKSINNSIETLGK